MSVVSKGKSIIEFVRLSVLPLKVPLALMFTLLAVLVYLLLSMAAYQAGKPIDCDPDGNIWLSLDYDGNLSANLPHRQD